MRDQLSHISSQNQDAMRTFIEPSARSIQHVCRKRTRFEEAEPNKNFRIYIVNQKNKSSSLNEAGKRNKIRQEGWIGYRDHDISAAKPHDRLDKNRNADCN